MLGVLDGKGSAELDDLEETVLEGQFVKGRLHGRVSIKSLDSKLHKADDIIYRNYF